MKKVKVVKKDRKKIVKKIGLKLSKVLTSKERKKDETILIISDMQIPFQHPDAIPFLKAVKQKYKPNRVFNVGDIIDSHALSFHEHDPDLHSAGDETEKAKIVIAELAKVFPEMEIALGNHDIRMFRKAKSAGIPKSFLRSIHEVLGTPKGWKFDDKIEIDLSNGDKVLMIHNCGNKDATKGVAAYGYSIIQGHHHTESSVQYVSTRDKLMFGMTVGSLIDQNALAFEYNKLDIKRPILSVALIINGVPAILPMPLNHHGKWTGQVL